MKSGLDRWGGRHPAIDVVLQFFAGSKRRNALGRYVNLGAGFRIAPGSAAALTSVKAAQAPDFDAGSPCWACSATTMSSTTDAPGTFRTVQVQLISLRGAGKLSARTRTGYYAPRALALDSAARSDY